MPVLVAVGGEDGGRGACRGSRDCSAAAWRGTAEGGGGNEQGSPRPRGGRGSGRGVGDQRGEESSTTVRSSRSGPASNQCHPQEL